MFDLHCHILPSIDDGAKTIGDSLAMARTVVAEGITHIMAIPLYKNDRGNNEKVTFLQRVDAVQQELDSWKISITLSPGQEVRITEKFSEDVKAEKIQFIDEANQYLLIEFPTARIPAFTDSLFFSLQTKRITSIIYHPGRNHIISNDPNELLKLVEKGLLAQLIAGSYTGSFGKKNQKFSKQLIEVDLDYFIASDAHNIKIRPFYMKEVYEKLGKKFNKQKVRQFKQVTKDLNNRELIIENSPKKDKQPKFLRRF